MSRAPKSSTLSVVASSVLALAAVACSSEEQIDPVAAPAGTDTTTSTSTGAGGAAPTAKRQVMLRNPIGGPLGNLLADGDFELSIVPEDYAGGQYGWVAFKANGAPSVLLGETGGLCKSGVRCARVDKNAVLFGRGAAAPDLVPHRATLWVKPLEEFTPPSGKGPCDFTTTYVLDCDSFDVIRQLKAPDAPDADGWCELRADIPGSATGLCMYSEIKIATLADAASLLPAPDLVMTRSAFQTPADLAERLVAARGWIRSRIGTTPGVDPSEPGRRVGDGSGE